MSVNPQSSRKPNPVPPGYIVLGRRELSIPRIIYLVLLVVAVVVGVTIAVDRARVIELDTTNDGQTITARTGMTVKVYLTSDLVKYRLQETRWRIISCPAALEPPRGHSGSSGLAKDTNVPVFTETFVFKAIQPGQGELVLNLVDKDGKVEKTWSVTVDVR